ncbi:hypothetical protein SCHPADRAFT_716122 [Schizopora paradoxa]|uniref:DUF3533 domain-containing protein n=1 Tax=Schizopora paradoxa TaxID=27342 RepID=A0A0H2R850_9AGAM|nr:hypothetical protein SCHPADRAFT_716122 [Schizopora paradoxa]
MDSDTKDLKDVEGGEGAEYMYGATLLQVAELQRSSSFVGKDENLKATDDRRRSRKISGTNSLEVASRNALENSVSAYQFTHSFWDPQISAQRREYLKIILRAMILTIILTWTCLPIYFGSMATSASRVGNLEVWYVNRDEARIGNNLLATVEGAIGKPGTLGWKVVNASDAGDDDAVRNAVIGETVWAVIVANENATLNLANARINGNDSYDPTTCITFYYAQARNEVASANFLVPSINSFLLNFTTMFSIGSAQRYFASISTANTSSEANPTVNVTAVQMLAQAPQTISPAVLWTTINLKPYTAPAAQAVTLVGQIYLCIFAFIICMAHSTARDLVSPYLSFSSYLSLRLGVPILVYVPLSVNYALVSIAFNLPFGGSGTDYTHGTAFLLFIVTIFLGMCALGLALEAMVTVLTTKFVPFFLVLLIIVNISTAALPPELQPEIYSYATGFPFWNIQQAVRTLLFGTNSHIPKNAAVLIAWTVLSFVTLSVFTFLSRKRDVARLASFAAGRNSKGRGGFASTPSYAPTPSSRFGGLVGLPFSRRRPGMGKSKLSDVEMHNVQPSRGGTSNTRSPSRSLKGVKTPDQWSIHSEPVDKLKNSMMADDTDVSIRDA